MDKKEWGRCERQFRLADIAEMRAGSITLKEAQDRARLRRLAAGFDEEEAARLVSLDTRTIGEVQGAIEAALLSAMVKPPNQEPILGSLASLTMDALRYRYLRNDRAYEPEEEGVHGGEDLDKLCDAGIARVMFDGDEEAGR